MSTPIETNTEELQEILQQVYDLPNAGSGGSSEPDLVIGLNVANTRTRTDDGIYLSLMRMTIDDVSIRSGQISTVKEKLLQGLPVKVQIEEIHFYAGDCWSKGLGEAIHVSLGCTEYYPSSSYSTLHAVFLLMYAPQGSAAWNMWWPRIVQIDFDIATGAPIRIGGYEVHSTT